ncbi:TIM23 complex component [Malassezia vespertilionis]|uniref:TIM23 complex component n=1 Tax=Malassezia vespertilionis TaxID=2020962 RepID=UPI0024B1EABC|nr:TIM23 complex component [Malassezia vespertilionis]WFD06881.1 TIM23 complex component [Malassezia vespertilionis]
MLRIVGLRMVPGVRGGLLVSRMLPRMCSAQNYTTNASEEPPLPWDTYLRLRKQRRMVGIVATIPTMLLTAVFSGSYFLTQEVEPGQMLFGIDPLFVNIGATLACVGAGWLIGPSIGNVAWSLFHRHKAAQIAQRDRQFYQHIRKMRADPSRQVMHNPVPDYYGEKIGSLHAYRQWLRDQVRFLHELTGI